MEKINGIAVNESGPRTAPAVVFIHGFPFNHTMWDAQARVLSKTHRVITYDVRGHGQSDCGDGQYTVELFVDDLFMILDQLKITRPVVCGLSMGGYIALRAVERQPDYFSGLVLCDTKSEADGNEAKIKRAGTIRSVKRGGVGPFAGEFVKTVFTEETLKSNHELTDFVLTMIQSNSVQGVCGALLALAARTDTTASLNKISIPALVLVGQEDKLTPPFVSEAMAKLLPQAEIHVIPAAAHLSNLENPRVFNEKLLGFLQSLKKQ